MAGTYTDIPGTRFALDQDGTVFKWRNYTTLSAWSDLSTSLGEVDKVNTANYITMGGSDNTIYTYYQMALAFPETRNISGIYIHQGFGNASTWAASNLTWESSADTTDGTDGTWSTFTVNFSSFASHNNGTNSSKPYYRSDIASVSLTGIKGIRLRWNSNVNAVSDFRIFVLHIYGSRPNTGVDRLDFWHPSSDQEITAAALDFGDMTQGTSATRQFRIKNLSSTLTANTVTVQVSDLLSEYATGELQISTDNTTYQSSVNIGNLASGTISSVLYVKRTVAAGEVTTQRHARLLASAASWS